ncbi:two-partner secretion domain-containing protein, partial [Phormidium sp. CCY1219]|uniref:two-partner secretion domain-containing protein n=1 Tax=Phormidium sp. CCY1219 TaxID=2886104 RepID=UPI002D1F543F
MKKITFVVAAIILGIFSEAGERQSLAQPIAPAADGTNTRVTPEENRYDIHGGKLSGDGGNLFHSFSRFGLDAGETANFISSPEIQNILGRVTGGDASIINGLIQVSGGNSNLFLVNPAGILFGPNATLNVPGDFTATSATRIGFGEHWFRSIGDNNWAALVGAPARFAFDVSYPGSIVNLGNLAVEPGGNIAFFGGTVLNAGTLSAPGGSITLAAVPGESAIRISQANHLLSLEVVASDSLTTARSLTPLALPELLTGGGANHARDVRVNPDGSIAISGSGMTLDPQPGDAIAAGTLDVAQRQGGALTGGEVNLLGTRVAAIDATIDASGNHGGGTIRIGGDFRGEGSIPNADRTFVSAHTQLNADALETGDGGRVIVWADENTWFSGKISARGGSAATSTPHNGGFVEISGKQTLQFRGEVDLRAPQGQLGTLLLDPTDIRIVATAGEAANDNELNADIPNAGDPQGAIFSGDGTGEYTISVETLSLLPASADIVLEATNDIVVENLGDGLIFAEGPGGSISLTADADGDGVGSFSMEDLNDGILARSRNLSISAASIAVGDVTTGTFDPGENGGEIRLTATNGDITAGNINSSADGNGGLAGNGGAIQVTATDNITIAEINSTSLDSLGGASTSNGGNIALNAGNTLTITTRINASSEPGGTGTGGNIELTGDEIELPTTPDSISSNNSATLTLQPNDAGRNIQVGATTTVAGSLNLTETEWLAIADGFSEKTIGRTDGSGTLTVDANGISSADPLILQSPNGAIAVQGPITGTDDASITLSGNTTLGANLTTATQWIIISGNTTLTNAATIETAGGLLQLGGTVDGNADLTLNAGTGTIEIADTVGSTTPLGAIAANSTGTTVFQGTIAAESLTTDAGGTTALNGNVTTTGTVGQVYGDDVTVVGDITLSGDELDFGATMLGNGAIALQPTTATQAIAIGNATDSGIGTLDITATDLAALQGFSSLTIGRSDGSGIVTSNTATLVFPTTIQSGSGDITFNTPLDGAQTLTVTSDSGAIAFNGAIGSTTALTALTATTNSDIALSSNVTTTGADGVSLTSANITLTGPVTIDTIIGHGAIALNSNAIDGNFPLNLTAGSADIALPAVGNTTPLDSLTATTTGAIALSGNLTTQGSDGVTLNAAGISLLSDVSIDTTTGNGNINFTGSVDGNQTLSLNAGTANITLENPVGETTPVNGLSLSGNQIQTEALSATNSIDINGSSSVTVFQPINSGNTVSIDGSDIETNGIIADSAVEING